PVSWLAEGEGEQPPEGDGPSVVRPKGFEPLTFWSVVRNPLTCIDTEPTDLVAHRSRRRAAELEADAA
ncbi:hypothetical protein, partial [Mycobacteroides abscessus]|uniref:hypothetical protein n=1 Tax=Mycobacteroides abscessus TaxID=36809 RepID=UPI001A99FD8B